MRHAEEFVYEKEQPLLTINFIQQVKKTVCLNSALILNAVFIVQRYVKTGCSVFSFINASFSWIDFCFLLLTISLAIMC